MAFTVSDDFAADRSRTGLGALEEDDAHLEQRLGDRLT